jgi:predicted transcriptional regulator
MAVRKIDKVKMSEMAMEGKSQREIAKYFGVTPGAVSQLMKEMSIAVVKSAVMENAHQVVRKNLDAVEQLQKINGYANELLDLLMRWNRGDKEAIQILESQARRVKVRGKEEEVAEYRLKDPRELALKAMAEIRGQLGLQLDIFKVLYDAEAVADFQQEVLTAIGEVNNDVRQKIIIRLKERRAIRGDIKIN